MASARTQARRCGVSPEASESPYEFTRRVYKSLLLSGDFNRAELLAKELRKANRALRPKQGQQPSSRRRTPKHRSNGQPWSLQTMGVLRKEDLAEIVETLEGHGYRRGPKPSKKSYSITPPGDNGFVAVVQWVSRKEGI